jgi:hypothetical protein
MEAFALSERWNGWTDIGVILTAARAAVAAGPLDPLVCEVTFETDFDTVSVDSLDEAEVRLREDPDPLSVDVVISHVSEDEATVTLAYNGRWLQLNGSGTDWQRARGAYYGAQVELAAAYGITTFRLPELPYDTVGELRRKQELAALEAALEDVEEPKDG